MYLRSFDGKATFHLHRKPRYEYSKIKFHNRRQKSHHSFMPNVLGDLLCEPLAVLRHLRFGDEAVVVKVQAVEELLHLLNVGEVLAAQGSNQFLFRIEQAIVVVVAVVVFFGGDRCKLRVNTHKYYLLYLKKRRPGML
jgi:hypothetical protein